MVDATFSWEIAMSEFRILDAARPRLAVWLWGCAIAALVLISGCLATRGVAAPGRAPGTPAASPVASPSPAGVSRETRDGAGGVASTSATPALPPVAIDVSP